jgi:hypothetical protein
MSVKKSKKFKLNFLFLCDEAFIGENRKLSIIGIFKVIKLRKVPGTYLKSVLVGSFSPLNKKIKDLNIKVNLLGPGGEPVGLSIPPVKLPTIEKKKRLRDVNFTLELGNLKFEVEGDYKFEVLANNELLGEYKFQVKAK